MISSLKGINSPALVSFREFICNHGKRKVVKGDKVSMNRITHDMLKIYKPLSGLDWLNYKIVRKEDITYHHIVKKEHGGKNTIDNGALLIYNAHRYLHIIENMDANTYNTLNNIFRMVNKQGFEPTFEERLVIETILCNFEKRYQNVENSKGKRLIRYEFLHRDFE